ncbi:undecaprenyl-diphosphatase UppP [Candidatus Kaiserbacteria bacterium]|nr:undecaprenyl-diphosphatase UppP [Candidatus Kaiserbacteria bacterium]
MDTTSAVILGLVQGVTEFLPVSSTGHLVLVRDWLSIDAINALAFDGVLHFATTAAVMLYFWSDIWVLLQTLLRKLGRLPVNPRDWLLLKALVIATIPAGVLGLFLESTVKHLQVPYIVAGVLFTASLFFMYVEWRYYLQPTHGALTMKRGIGVGLFQALALIPGFSRSGSTIAGGMLLGMSRYEASRFSFLLAIPITFAAGSKMLLELLSEGGEVNWSPIFIGAIVAFFTALVVIHFFLAFIRKYTLWPFVWYGIILASAVGYVAFVS